MDFSKLKRKRVIVWGATSVFLTGLLITANVLMRNEFSSVLNQTFGGKRAITVKSNETIEFPQSYFTKKEARDNGNRVTEKICEEGMILLKNDNNALPLKKNAKVSVFGNNSVNLVYGGSGSANPDADDSAEPRKTIFDSLSAQGFEYNQKLVDLYTAKTNAGEKRSDNPEMEHKDSDAASLLTGELPVSVYDSSITSSYDEYGDAALVVFSRIAGENWDLPRVASDDANRHYLELDNNERALLKHIVDSGKFAHIVVLMNGSNYIDLGFLKDNSIVDSSKIDACINIGSPGGYGIMALGRILSGEVNPSGHTVDLVYTNYKNDPTWQNFGGNFKPNGDEYLTSSGNNGTYFFVEYEENIYMGYRYYETRGKDDAAWYDQNVVYPFGYGLSYTTFSQEIVNKGELDNSALNANQKFEIEVKVTNTGDRAGKEVVQVYVEAPYTANGIEKPYKVLAGFAKTKELGKNESETVKIEVDPYYFASFDSHDANGDGFRGYTLDEGDYIFHVATDSHHDIDTFTKKLDAKATYANDPVTGTKVEPLFDDVSGIMEDPNNPGKWIKDDKKGGMESLLSRTDWTGTFPTTVTDDERKIDGALFDKLDAKESGNNDTYTTIPKMGQTNGDLIKLRKLVGLEYNDPKWDEFLDQLTFEEMELIFDEGCYSTTDITRKVDGEDFIIVPATTSADGPTGLVSFLGNVVKGSKPAVYGCCYYCSECLLSQTYNLELAKEQAAAIGDEALVGNERGDGLAYPGWYAPAVNLHRSPFSGRNTEYYSEDPLLSGKFAATVIDGVQQKGVYANVKHFALNDQETHRSAKGIATWCDEQAMRELYFRPFEIAIKEGKSKGLMTSFNRLGTTWAGGDYRLVTTVLRKEWGFVGSVICDFHTDDYMDSKQMLYAGGDINLVSADTHKLKKTDVKATNAKDVTLLRNAVHNTLYCIANSNIMKAEIVGYKNPVWVNVLTGCTIGVAVGIVGWGAWAIASSLLKKEEVGAAAEAVSEATGETKAE